MFVQVGLVVPLVLAHGAGGEVRAVTGVTVFAGMPGVPLFGLFQTPVFYVALRRLVTRGRPLAQQVLPLEVSHVQA